MARSCLGLDISTQSVTALVLGVTEDAEGRPVAAEVRGRASARFEYQDERRRPQAWVGRARECLAALREQCPAELARVEAAGLSTAFPGLFVVDADGEFAPELTCLYDNTDDLCGICSGQEPGLWQAECAARSRMWTGNMVVGLANLWADPDTRPRLLSARGLLPPNTAFAVALLAEAGCEAPADLPTDFSQGTLGALPQSPDGPVGRLIQDRTGMSAGDLGPLLAKVARQRPAWSNVLPAGAVAQVAAHLGLPALQSLSIGAGDSGAGVLPFIAEVDGGRGSRALEGAHTRDSSCDMLVVRGSSDTPLLLVSEPLPGTGPREALLHFPAPTAPDTGAGARRWIAAAPLMRSGLQWDWVRALRWPEGGADADAELMRLVVEALCGEVGVRDGQAGTLALRGSGPLLFLPHFGGTRVPDWRPDATGTLRGLRPHHGLGHLALAACEGVALDLRAGILALMGRHMPGTDIAELTLHLTGGPARNDLWNWLTWRLTGTRAVLASDLADASVLGAATLGYLGLRDGEQAEERAAAVSACVAARAAVRSADMWGREHLPLTVRAGYGQRAEALRRRYAEETSRP